MDFPPIYGFNECSEMGNDIFAPSIFMGGCNLKCPYCMNSKLISCEDNPQIDLDDVLDYIKKNNSEWIMISGGEPTCSRPKLLENLVKCFSGFGCKVGLSTNGTNADNLEGILGWVHYVALDIKSHRDDVYKQIVNGASSNRLTAMCNVLLSQALLAEAKFNRDDFDYEIRTTLYPKYIDKEAIKEIGTIIRGSDKWVLQQFRHANNMFSQDAYDVKPYTDEEAKDLLKIAKKITSKAELRYV